MLVSAQEYGVAASWLNLLREPAETLRAAAHARVSAEMQAPSMTATVLGLAEWGAPAGEAMDRPLRDLAPDLLKRLEHKVARRGQHIARRGDSELHALRKATKKLRYSIEFLAPLFRHSRPMQAAVEAARGPERRGGDGGAGRSAWRRAAARAGARRGSPCWLGGRPAGSCTPLFDKGLAGVAGGADATITLPEFSLPRACIGHNIQEPVGHATRRIALPHHCRGWPALLHYCSR